jgi:hypothetical protein
VTLEQYKKQFKVSFSSIARQCDYSVSYFHGVATGKRRPNFDLALKIERATNGHVGRENWYTARSDASIKIKTLTPALLKDISEGLPESLCDPAVAIRSRSTVRAALRPSD